jgi:hypothetical protein
VLELWCRINMHKDLTVESVVTWIHGSYLELDQWQEKPNWSGGLYSDGARQWEKRLNWSSTAEKRNHSNTSKIKHFSQDTCRFPPRVFSSGSGFAPPLSSRARRDTQPHDRSIPLPHRHVAAPPQRPRWYHPAPPLIGALRHGRDWGPHQRRAIPRGYPPRRTAGLHSTQLYPRLLRLLGPRSRLLSGRLRLRLHRRPHRLRWVQAWDRHAHQVWGCWQYGWGRVPSSATSTASSATACSSFPNPFREDPSKAQRDWDLGGPFVFIVFLSLTVSSATVTKVLAASEGFLN